jgi:hypothetical protein
MKQPADLCRGSLADGGFPVIVPTCGWGNDELTPAWDAAYPVIL